MFGRLWASNAHRLFRVISPSRGARANAAEAVASMAADRTPHLLVREAGTPPRAAVRSAVRRDDVIA
jgi:hypothetical protein